MLDQDRRQQPVCSSLKLLQRPGPRASGIPPLQPRGRHQRSNVPFAPRSHLPVAAPAVFPVFTGLPQQNLPVCRGQVGGGVRWGADSPSWLHGETLERRRAWGAERARCVCDLQEWPGGPGSSPPPLLQTLLLAAHEVELQRQKEAEKLERQLALPSSEQAATQVSPHLPAPPPPSAPPHPVPWAPPPLLPPPPPRSQHSRRCARGC